MSHFRDSQEEADVAAFGLRLRTAAERMGYSAADLCRMANITKQSMSAYWNGSRLCSADRLFALADVLDVDARWLITGRGAMSEDAQLLQRFRALDGHARGLLLDLTELIARSRR